MVQAESMVPPLWVSHFYKGVEYSLCCYLDVASTRTGIALGTNEWEWKMLDGTLMQSTLIMYGH